MKILHLTGAIGWGGNEQQLIHLINELNKWNIESTIFGVENSVIHNYSKKLSFQFICCKDNKLNNFKNYKYLSSIVKKISPDIIHLHTSDSVTVYVVADLLYKLKTHTVFSKKGISRKTSILSKYKYNYKNIDKVLCVSQVVKRHFEDVLNQKHHHKLTVVYDGVKIETGTMKAAENIKKTYNISEDTQVIGSIANHNGAKDLPTLVKTLNLLVNERGIENIHLLQVGDFTRATPELKALVSKYKLEKYITFTGFKENAASILMYFDLFLMTSVREGGPTSVLEAMYKKVPVVTTKVGVVTEIIEDGVNGFVADIGDCVVLADKIEILLQSESLKESFSEISFNKFLESFTAEKLGQNTLHVYENVLNKTKGTA